MFVNQSVISALKLLDLFVDESRDLSLSEIHKKTDMSKSKVFRLLSSLVYCGFLKRTEHTDRDVRYQLGVKLLQLGNIVSERFEVQRIALPFMKKLCDEINEIVHLAVLDGMNAVYIEKVEGKQEIRLYTKVGRVLPLHIGSGPKLLFAFMTTEEQEETLKNTELKALTKNTITDKVQLLKELESIRSKGYSMSFGEQNLDTIGISYPIKDYSGRVIAALTVSGPSNRLESKRRTFIGNALEKTALTISNELGFGK